MKMLITAVSFKFYCTCGVGSYGTMPMSAVQQMREEFGKLHQGPGHEVCPSRKAAKKRAAELRKGQLLPVKP